MGGMALQVAVAEGRIDVMILGIGTSPLSVTRKGDLAAFLYAPAGTCFDPGSSRSTVCQPVGPVKR